MHDDEPPGGRTPAHISRSARRQNYPDLSPGTYQPTRRPAPTRAQTPRPRDARFLWSIDTDPASWPDWTDAAFEPTIRPTAVESLRDGN